jgi:cyclophilin family peptidyl-prolyl cis-trans isomerase
VKRFSLAFSAILIFSRVFGQTQALPDGLYAQIKTDRGIIIADLSYKKAPMAVSNFVGLAEGTLRANGVSGKRFYDGLTFHRVVAGFVIQGGDPKGDGTGGPGYEFPDETSADLKHDGPGILAMANSGPNTNGSQFYITLKATPELDGAATVFGRVVQGQNVVDATKQGDRIRSVTILRVGAAATSFTVTQLTFDAMMKKSRDAVEEKRNVARIAALYSVQTQWPGLTVTKSGLMYRILSPGDGRGPNPSKGMTVTLNYTGKFLDGRVFESTTGREGPVQFIVGMGKVIKGWDEALLAMKKGEKRLVVVPPELAYGSRGYTGVIPPDSFLVFELELVDFK